MKNVIIFFLILGINILHQLFEDIMQKIEDTLININMVKIALEFINNRKIDKKIHRFDNIKNNIKMNIVIVVSSQCWN